MKRTAEIILLLLLLFPVCHLNAQDTGRYEEQKARLEKEIEMLDRQLSENASKSRSELSRLTLVRSKVSGRKALIAESDKQIRRYSDQIYLTQREINRLGARLDTLSGHYANLIRSAYKNRDAKVWYMYILASEDLGQAFRRYSYFKNLSSRIKVQVDKINETSEQLRQKKSELSKMKKEAESLREERKTELAGLQKEENEVARIVSNLKRNRSKYEQELAAKKKQVQALDREIKRIISEAVRDSGQASKEKKQIDYKLSSEFSSNKGKLPWPATGPVVDRFGQNYHPVFKNVKLPFNNGITVAVLKGSSVSAVFDGVVKQIVVMPGYNQCVLVQHGKYFSFYCKLRSTVVKPGDKIKTGQKIGVVDTINGETQLHFQIWQDNKPQNPEIWLRPR